MTKYLTYREVAALFGVNPATVWRWRKTDGFPHPVRIGRSTTRFNSDEVDEWLKTRKRA